MQKNCFKVHNLKSRPVTLQQGLLQTELCGISTSNLLSDAVCLKTDFLQLAIKNIFKACLIPWRKDLEKRAAPTANVLPQKVKTRNRAKAALWQIYSAEFATL